jgi:hypothetical protein
MEASSEALAAIADELQLIRLAMEKLVKEAESLRNVILSRK